MTSKTVRIVHSEAMRTALVTVAGLANFWGGTVRGDDQPKPGSISTPAAQAAAQATPAVAQPAQTATTYVPHAVEVMRREAGKVMRTTEHAECKRFCVCTTFLPAVDDRTIYRRKEPYSVVSQLEFEQLPESEKPYYQAIVMDSHDFYYTRYGSPLAYARPLDILMNELGSKVKLEGKKIIDFGFGSYGQVRMMAQMGAHVTGIEVDPILRALYSDPKDVGIVESVKLPNSSFEDGSLKLVFGSWPAQTAARDEVGETYDIFITKNTLKKGYIHPARETDEKKLLKLGVSDEEFVANLARVIRPGGYMLVYNICPAQAAPDQPYIPWADGEFPFPRDMMERAGFTVVAWDKDDTEAGRKLGSALGWDAGNNPMDLEKDLKVWYTLLMRNGGKGDVAPASNPKEKPSEGDGSSK